MRGRTDLELGIGGMIRTILSRILVLALTGVFVASGARDVMGLHSCPHHVHPEGAEHSAAETAEHSLDSHDLPEQRGAPHHQDGAFVGVAESSAAGTELPAPCTCSGTCVIDVPRDSGEQSAASVEASFASEDTGLTYAPDHITPNRVAYSHPFANAPPV